MGEHYVAVGFDRLTWVDQPSTSTISSTTSTPMNAPAASTALDNVTRTSTGTSTTGSTTTTTTTTTSANKNWYPDHAVLNATKDELKAMPEFKF